jgi:hypothetical protein
MGIQKPQKHDLCNIQTAHNDYSHKNPLPDRGCSCRSPDENLFLSGEFLSIRNKVNMGL